MRTKDILNQKQKLSEILMPCIYFLIEDDKIVYVGQSKNGLSRIFKHVRDKNFDHYIILPCDENKLDKEETKYILKYQPFYNKNLSDKRYISLQQLNRKVNLTLTKLRKFIAQFNIKLYNLHSNIYINKEEFKTVINNRKIGEEYGNITTTI